MQTRYHQIKSWARTRGNCVDRDWTPRIGLSAWEKPGFVTRVIHPDVVANPAVRHTYLYTYIARVNFGLRHLATSTLRSRAIVGWKSSWPVEHADRPVGCLGNTITASNRYDGDSIRAHIRTKLNELLFTGGGGGRRCPRISFVHNDVCVKYHDQRRPLSPHMYIHTIREKLRLYIIRQVDG